MRFWDSSAVVPLLVQQAQSDLATRWLEQDGQVATWTLTPVEVASALWRLVRDGELAEATALEADQRAQEFSAAAHTVVDVEAVKLAARRLLRVHPLRAADAAQLGAALLWAGGRPHDRVVHTFDERLARAARREGFVVP
jgi:predicted nucleic acid-binding protein